MCVYVCVSVCVGVGVGVGVCVVVGGAWILKGRVCGGLVTGSPHARSHHHPRMMNPCMRMSVWVYVCGRVRVIDVIIIVSLEIKSSDWFPHILRNII